MTYQHMLNLFKHHYSFIYWEINSCYEFNCFCEFITSFEGKKILFFIRKNIHVQIDDQFKD